MQKAPVMKGSGLIPLEESKLKEEVHVFGKNLEERVITESDDTPSISFNNIPNKRPTEDEDDNIESIRKRKFEAITGEEDEETIFQGDFKLFSWDLTTSNWIEKGRGHLKLNDSTTEKNKKKSRLIMRVNGTLRIILNVAINRPLFKIIASTKDNIRFTDGQTVWAASGCYADQLNRMIEERIQKNQEYIEHQTCHEDQKNEKAKDEIEVRDISKEKEDINDDIKNKEIESEEETKKNESDVVKQNHEHHEDEQKPEVENDQDDEKQENRQKAHDDNLEVLKNQSTHESDEEEDDSKRSKKTKLESSTP